MYSVKFIQYSVVLDILRLCVERNVPVRSIEVHQSLVFIGICISLFAYHMPIRGIQMILILFL